MRIPDLQSDEIKSFIAYLSHGVDFETSAHASMISLDELYFWLERGKVEDERLSRSTTKPKKVETPYLALWRLVRTNRAKALAELQVNLNHAAKDDGKLALAILERVMPERFSKASDRKALRDMEAGVTHGSSTAAIDASS